MSACALAGVILLVLLFGHVLRYPVAGLREDDSAALEAQLQTNQALRDQLARLRSAAIATTCQPPAPGASPRGAAIEPALLPPAPASTPVALPAAGPGRPAAPGTLAGLLDRATVLVLAGDSLGSGFFVSDRDIVTNHHVVGDLREVRVGNKALGGFESARVVAVGAGDARGTEDLAVLEVEPKAGTAALQVGIVPERLAPVTAAGYPGAVLETIKGASADALPEANFTQGILTSRQVQAPAGIGTLIHTAQIGHGNSGGPLVDAGGCAVGVNSWLSFDASDDTVFSTYFQALDAGELRKFLQVPRRRLHGRRRSLPAGGRARHIRAPRGRAARATLTWRRSGSPPRGSAAWPRRAASMNCSTPWWRPSSSASSDRAMAASSPTSRRRARTHAPGTRRPPRRRAASPTCRPPKPKRSGPLPPRCSPTWRRWPTAFRRPDRSGPLWPARWRPRRPSRKKTCGATATSRSSSTGASIAASCRPARLRPSWRQGDGARRSVGLSLAALAAPAALALPTSRPRSVRSAAAVGAWRLGWPAVVGLWLLFAILVLACYRLLLPACGLAAPFGGTRRLPGVGERA